LTFHGIIRDIRKLLTFSHTIGVERSILIGMSECVIDVLL